MTEIVVDSFAGGGGASLGIEQGLGRPVDIAINHDREAVAMHEANHPHTVHLCQDIWQVDPREATGGRPVGLMWASPDCRHFSKAKGGRPVSRQVRDLANVVVEWAAAIGPRVVMLENVEEFRTWGPLDDRGMPIKERSGETFREWVESFRQLGYEIEWRELRAADYGAPTIRRRLFIIARRDGERIRWPLPTHTQPGRGFGLEPWRTAAECIDWSIPAPSIFDRTRPLAEATLRRIAAGVKRFVIEAAEPFIVNLTHGGRLEPLSEPMNTVTGAHRGEKAVVSPYLVGITHNQSGDGFVRGVDGPWRTITASRGGEEALIAPTLIQTGWGERPGQAPRVPGLHKPLGTVMGGGVKHALVVAFLSKYFTGVVGAPLTHPAPTVTARDHNSRDDTDLADPMGTVTERDRFALVMIHGEPYAIADIGMRMLEPRELFRAQGFPEGYVINPVVGGRELTKTAQVRMCGNSVCPPAARALVAANVEVQGQRHMWPGWELAAGGAR